MTRVPRPGAWRVTAPHSGAIGDNAAIYAGDVNVAVCDRAHAALIAAAPDLLAVVQELIESASYWSEYDVPLGIVDRMRAALAKATAPRT